MKRKITLALVAIALSLPLAAQRYITPLGPWNGDIQMTVYGGIVSPQGSHTFEFDHLDNDFLAEGGVVQPTEVGGNYSAGIGIGTQMVALADRTWRWGLHLDLGGYNNAYYAIFHGTDIATPAGTEASYLPGSDYRFNVSSFNIEVRFGAEGVWMPTNSLQVCFGGGVMFAMELPRSVTTTTITAGKMTDSRTDKTGNLRPRLGLYANAAVNYFINEGLFVGLAAHTEGVGFMSEKQDLLGSLLTSRLDAYRPSGVFLQVGVCLYSER